MSSWKMWVTHRFLVQILESHSYISTNLIEREKYNFDLNTSSAGKIFYYFPQQISIENHAIFLNLFSSIAKSFSENHIGKIRIKQSFSLLSNKYYNSKTNIKKKTNKKISFYFIKVKICG